MSESTLAQIENQLELLIQRFARLREENAILKEKEAQWTNEKARLQEKNELARARIEAMLNRLKQIETETQ